jgi:hypothetical protein
MPGSTSPIANDLFVWSEVARNFGILIAGILGVGIAWWRSRAANLQARAALEQSELARRDHITEIFNRAVGQLADERLEVRLGAIYTLRAICDDERYGPYTWPISETLAAYVRERSGSGESKEMSTDIAAIIEWLHIEKNPEEGK